MQPLKAISLSRPWPYTIAHLGKLIENRSHGGRMPPMCKYRGPLLLHAAKSWNKGVGDWCWERGLLGDGAIVSSAKPSRLDHAALNDRSRHPTGIVGRCRVVGHVEPIGHVHKNKNAFGGRPHTQPEIVVGDVDPRDSGEPGFHRGSACSEHFGIAAPNQELFDYADSLDMRWWMGGYALVLAEVEVLPQAIPCRGHRQLWDVPDDVVAQLPPSWRRAA